MSKNKEDLLAEAQSLGIDVSDDPTKAVLQERIDSKMSEMADNMMDPNALLGNVHPSTRFMGGRGDQNIGQQRRVPLTDPEDDPDSDDGEPEADRTDEEILALGTTADLEGDEEAQVEARSLLAGLAEDADLDHEDYETWTGLAQALNDIDG